MANTWGSLNAANNAPNFQVFAGQSQNAVGSVFYANDTTMFIAANSPLGANVGGVRLSVVGVNNKQTGQVAQAAAAGLTAVGVANNSTIETASHPQHAGWQLRTEFTGPLTLSFVGGFPAGGQGVNSNGFIILTGNTSGSGYNLRFLYGNTLTGVVGPAGNVFQNGIVSVVGSMGSNFNVAPTGFVLNYDGSSVANTPISAPTGFTFGVGGRGGRVQYETLITMANIA